MAVPNRTPGGKSSPEQSSAGKPTPRKPKGARANRENKPTKRRDGRWSMRLYPPKGSIRTKPRLIYGKTRAECKANHDQAKKDQDAGILPEPGDDDLKIGPAMRHWLYTTLPQYVRAGKMKQTTMVSYQDTAELHIIPPPGKPGPTLAHIGLLELKAPAVRDWLDALLQKPSGRQRRKLRPGETELPPPVLLGPRTPELARSILHKFLEDMIRDETGALTRNVVDLVDPPEERGKKARPALRAEQVAALMIEMAKDKLWCYWLIAFAQGFRRGEGLGMRWEDLDFDARTWTPVLQVQWLRGERDPASGKRKGKLVLMPLKTDASGEKTALTRTAAQALARWETEQNRMRASAPAWAELGLIFTTGLGRALSPRNVDRAWEALCVRAGVPGAHLHDLRHACASYALAAGADSKSVQKLLRHARLATTELYLHAIEEVPRAAADAIDSVIEGLRALDGVPDGV